MEMKYFPGINLEATGKHIAELRVKRGLTVKDLQDYFGFGAPQAIYKWQNGASLPTVDNLLALSMILEVPMESILVTGDQSITPQTTDEPAGSVFLQKITGKLRFPCKAELPKTISYLLSRSISTQPGPLFAGRQNGAAYPADAVLKKWSGFAHG